MLVARQHPRDAVQIDAVLMLKNAACPYTGRDGITAIDADPPALEILRRSDAAAGVVQDCAVMKRAHGKHRNRSKRLAVCPRADVSRDRQLRDVELEASHHPAERLDDHWYLFEREVARARPNTAVPERLRVSTRHERCVQPRSFHRQ